MTGKVLGFRAWGLDGYKLMSANRGLGAYWTIGVNKAECRAAYWQGTELPQPPSHEAPDPQCQCGLYALHDHNYWPTIDNPMVFGAVLAWGRMEVHAEGFRAQYAEPVMLAYDPRQSYEHVKRVEAIAGEMELPFVCVIELEKEAGRFGKTVAAELRPEMSDWALLLGSTSRGMVGTQLVTAAAGRASQRATSSVVSKPTPALLAALAPKPTWKDRRNVSVPGDNRPDRLD